MKKPASLIACLLIILVLSFFRTTHPRAGKPLMVTDWDALGYYMYLPSILIYHDYKELKWMPEIDRKYKVTGGDLYQADHTEQGGYVFKYLGGVALMQLPFFLIGHQIAKATGYPADGFSPPYEYAITIGALLYAFLAILLLRRVLLYYFSDGTVAITLLLLCLASNYLQYAAIENGQSHAYIFLLYVLILYTTIRWHRQPRMIWALLTGYIIGLATISRPTEAIMLFIPLLWGMQNKAATREKWALVRAHKSHVLYILAGGFLGILPQLIYWKSATGSWIFDVGSKWDFLNPHFRVLFGWEKGWFIYTPVTILFIAGMFFLRSFPFKKPVLWFCLLNIWIIIAWSDWRYGGTYSTRALVQSYPVFALPLAALVTRVQQQRWRPVLYLAGAYLLFVNFFQIGQYNKTILHYNDMNRHYYSRIYLNPHPDPVDMSALDTNDILDHEGRYRQSNVVSKQYPDVHFAAGGRAVLLDTAIRLTGKAWLKTEATVIAPDHLYQSMLQAELQVGDSVLRRKVRLFNPIGEATHQYAFYIKVPEAFDQSQLRVYLSSPNDFTGTVTALRVSRLER